MSRWLRVAEENININQIIDDVVNNYVKAEFEPSVDDVYDLLKKFYYYEINAIADNAFLLNEVDRIYASYFTSYSGSKNKNDVLNRLSAIIVLKILMKNIPSEKLNINFEKRSEPKPNDIHGTKKTFEELTKNKKDKISFEPEEFDDVKTVFDDGSNPF